MESVRKSENDNNDNVIFFVFCFVSCVCVWEDDIYSPKSNLFPLLLYMSVFACSCSLSR